MLVSNEKNKLNLELKNTDINTGLGNNDTWCSINIKILENDNSYCYSGEFLTKNEVINIIEKIEELLDNDLFIKTKLIFIKNYFSIKLYIDNKKNKVVEVNLASIKNNKKMKFTFTGENINNLLTELKSIY